MEVLDQDFTEKIQRWLDTPPSERNLLEGAEMYLRLRPQNRVLYQHMILRPESNAGRIEYELRKHLNIRLQGYTIRQVAVLDHTLVPIVAAKLTDGFQGKREDHDSLPDNIKQLYDRNGVLFEQQKQLYNQLLEMDNSPACDRAELLFQLKKLDDEYHDNYEQYDHYVPAQAPPPSSALPHEPDGGKVTVADAKEVNAARKFVSQNLKKIETEEMNEKKRNELVQAIFERVKTIEKSGGGFKAEQAARLQAIGIETQVEPT